MRARFLACASTTLPSLKEGGGNFDQTSSPFRGETRRKIIGASLLVLALSCFTYAGNMPYPAPDTRPAPAAQGTAGETADGHIPNGRIAGSTAATVTEVVLGLLRSVLPWF